MQIRLEWADWSGLLAPPTTAGWDKQKYLGFPHKSTSEGSNALNALND